jgi:hypothetical protein
MDYLRALSHVHEIIKPANYCEIGCRLGISLALSRAPSTAIDPDFEIRTELTAPTRLYRKTSDAFFAAADCANVLGAPIDFGFIDGMHLVEYALRDFINIEKHSTSQGIIAIDDLLPQDMRYTSRQRETQIWTGDVYRVIPIIRMFRPDLQVHVFDVEMKGFGLVSGLDPSSAVLPAQYENIVADLAGGRWELPSPAAIRRALTPRPVGELVPHLQQLANTRRKTTTC